MSIDIERLKTDHDYWDEVAPQGSGFYGEEDYEWVESWYKKQDDIWYRHIGAQGWTNISNAGCDFDDFIHSRAGSLINRPETQTTQWSGPQDGWPPVGTECELWVGGVFDDVVEFIGLRNEYTAVFWRLNRDVPDAGELPTVEFRPIQTEHDKVIEKAVRTLEMKHGSPKSIYLSYCETLYDTGMLKQAGGVDD
jgi:hypothetical protein